MALLTALAGITAVPITPFDSQNRVDCGWLQTVVDRIVVTGVGVVAACGNTAEYSALSSREARAVGAATIEASGAACTLVGVGKDIATARREARSAMAQGADGIMIHELADPYVSERGYVRYVEGIASSIEGPVVLYLRRKLLSLDALGQLAGLESVVAVKYGIRDMLEFADFAAEYGEAVVPICGLAETWAPFFWAAGARGFTSGLVNLAPKLSLAMLTALQRGDYAAAARLWAVIRPFEDMRNRNGGALNVTTVKAAMHLAGLLPNPAVRTPNAELSDAEHAELEELMRHLIRAVQATGQSVVAPLPPTGRPPEAPQSCRRPQAERCR